MKDLQLYLDKIKVGKTIQVKDFYFYKYHILAIIEGMVVYKYYGKHKQWWHYDIESPRSLAFKMKLRDDLKNK